MATLMAACAVLAIAAAAMASVPAPVPNPARPKPFFSWDYIPLAFHGANRSGMYNAETVEVLGRHYQMVTIEKWYTACGSKHPIQNGPWCDVEAAMYTTFNQLKAINPNITNIMYLNSMMDFTMYNLHQMAMDLEAAGTRVWLRDKHDNMVIYCNDGNYYCDVVNWDWTQQAARDLWTSHVVNATKVGGVDGIFADHATVRLYNHDLSICNGAHPKRSCFYFEKSFAEAFDQGHEWIVNHTQNMLAPLGGPVIDGPYGKYNTDVCDFDTFKATVQRGVAGTGAYVLEASKGGCTPDASCIASYLLNAVEYSYLSCLSDEPTFNSFPDLARPLGPPLGDATLQGGVWTRYFAKGAIARWYVAAAKGTMQWPGQPPPEPPTPKPAPPPAPPVPAHPNVTANCGAVLDGKTFAQNDVGVRENVYTAQQCCDFCAKREGCIEWAWHSEVSECHAHGTESAGPNTRKGSFAGVLQKL